MTIPAAPDQWDLARLRQLVSEQDLERTRIEYKRELGNGNPTLEAITALANTFGGVVLVGVDEAKHGTDRLTGVAAGERDRLARMCWDKLVPPYSPEISTVKLDASDKYVLVVLINLDYARRPIMLTQGNKILVRLEGHSVPADWYRLRELFAEEQATATPTALPPSPNFIPTPGLPHADLGIRSRLLLTGPRGSSHYITETARTAALDVLKARDCPLTGTQSTLAAMMGTWAHGGPWNARNWMLRGRASTNILNANWHGLLTTGQVLTEARLAMELTQTPSRGGNLLITLETVLTNPRRAVSGNQASERLSNPEGAETGLLMELAPTSFVSLDGLRRLILNALATLWGPLGAEASTGILGQPLGPPAQLDWAVFTIAGNIPSQIGLNHCIDFGTARLIPENIPSSWTEFNPIQADHKLLDPAEQERAVHDWLIRFGVYNGYQNIEQELAHQSQT